MSGDGDTHNEQTDDVEASGCARAPQDAQLAHAAMALLGCHTEDEVYRVAGEFVAELIPNAFINVNEITPDLDFFITRGMFGADRSMLSDGAKLIGFEIVGRRWAIQPDFRESLISGTLSKIPGGFAGLAVNEIPLPVAKTLASAFGIRDLFVIGIADSECVLGNIAILTRTPDAILPTYIIESFAHHCYSALERIHRTRELADIAERNSLMLRNMAEGLALHEIVLDEHGKPCDYRILDVNLAFEELIGLRTEDLIGRTVLELFPDIEPCWLEKYSAVATTGAPTRFEGSAGLPGRQFEVSAYAPKPGQLAAVLTDVTERNQSRVTLSASEAKFSTAFRTSPDAVNINRLSDGLFLDVNDGFTNLTGYTADDVAGKTSSDIRIWNDPADRERLVAGLRAEGVVRNLKAQFRRKDGSVTTALMSARVMEVDGENCILSVTRDISDRDSAEQALRESEARYRTITENISDVVWILDPQTLRFLYVSPSVERLRGYTPEEIIAEPMDAALTPEGAQAVRALLAQRFEELRISGKPPVEPDIAELEQPCKDGSTIWTEVVTTYHLNEQTGLPEIHGVTRDITERRQAETRLRESEQWLSASQRVAHLGHYLYDIEKDEWTGSPSLYETLGNDETWKRDFAGWIEIVHPEDRQRLSRYFTEDVLDKGQPFDIEYRIIRPVDGAERWVHGLGSVDYAEDGHPLVMFGIIQDITEGKLADELLAKSLASIIEVVGRVVETRDPYTAGHQQRVSELAVVIAEDMGIPVRQIEEIRVAGLIHDVGKMSVPAEILSKPGRLSPMEFELIKTHSETGYQIISSADMQGPIAEIVHQHHERCDGSGYPRGLRGDELLEGAKIIMVADVVEAMSSHRPYRASLGIEPAMAEIERGATEGQFDVGVAEACKRVFDAGFAFSKS